MKKILPLINPISSCYPVTSQTSGILFADPLIHDWMMNNFIQVFEVDEINHAIDYYDFAADNNPFLSYNEIDYSFICGNWSSLSTFLKSAIEDDYYIRIFVNKGKLKLYQTSHEDYHDLMVYGYDDKNKRFYIADHFHGGQFLMTTCSYNELEKAVDRFVSDKYVKPAFLSSVQMIKKECDFMRLRYSMYSPEQMDYIMTFNTNRIYQSLLCYIEEKPVTGWFTRGRVMDENMENNHCWGIQCYRILMQYVDRLESGVGRGAFAKQSFYVMENHKTLMVERIRTLQKKIDSVNWEEDIQNFEKLEQLLKSITLRYIKCIIYKENGANNYKKVCDQLKSKIQTVEKMDQDYTNRLIARLEKCRRKI